jgi:hypothetical protein
MHGATIKIKRGTVHSSEQFGIYTPHKIGYNKLQENNLSKCWTLKLEEL